MKIDKLNPKNLTEFLPIFAKVLKTGFPEYSPELIDHFLKKEFSKEIFSKKLESSEWLGLLAIFSGKIVGFLVSDKLYGGVSYCTWVGVIKKLQGKGIGSRLLKTWEKEVKKRGGHKLFLLTQSRKNRQFYLKNGFRQQGFEEKSWFGLDCWTFGKVIGEPKPEVFLN